MTVEVRLFATLAQFLPPGSQHGLARIDVPQGATLAELIARLGIPAGLERVTLINGADASADRRLQSGDIVDIFPPLAGGAVRRPARRAG